MKRTTSLSRQRGRGVVGTIVLALVLGGVLVGVLYWWSSRPAANETPASAPATPVAATEETPAPAPIPEGDPAELAELAMEQKRMFVPPGNNAFELYLAVLDADPTSVQARNALGELFPYAVLYVEQRIAAADAADGERVLALMQRADAAAPALPRLTAQIGDLRRREAQQQAEAERRAAAAAAAPATTAPAPAPVAATPAAPPPAASTAPAPAPAASAPVATTTPPAASTTPAAAPPPAAAPAPAPAASSTRRTPVVVSSAQPRYPVMAKRRGIEGRVELAFTILPDGTVGDIEVVSSEPGGTFDRDAIAAMQRWRFEPGEGEIRARRAFDFKIN